MTLAERWGRDRPRFVPDLRKYSEDQPRDERGRWTSGGGDEPSPRGAGWDRTIAEIRGQGMGNCYQAACTMILRRRELGLENPVIVQAEALGSPGSAIEGKRFGHAWVEADMPGWKAQFPGHAPLRVAYDYSSGKSVELPASLYRQLGQVTDVHEYTDAEALIKMVETQHYGPWYR